MGKKGAVMFIKSLGASLVSGGLLLVLATTGLCGQGWLEQGKQVLDQLSGESAKQGLSTETIGDGLLEALRVGTANVVQQLGQPGGFLNNPEIHIPLPESMQKVQSVLSKVGASSMLDDLELKLNRAAEKATPRAKDLFWQSISEMTLEDVRSIYNGPDDAATRYFQRTMSDPLAGDMQPIVEDTLSQVGAVQSYDRVMDRYTSIPFVPDVKADLVSHTLDRTLDGLFSVLAREEAAIRSDPAKQTTKLLKTVFGNN